MIKVTSAPPSVSCVKLVIGLNVSIVNTFGPWRQACLLHYFLQMFIIIINKFLVKCLNTLYRNNINYD